MSEKLLPCPFCGKPPQNDWEAGVWCATPGCDFIQTLSLESWNTRPTPPAEKPKCDGKCYGLTGYNGGGACSCSPAKEGK